MNHYCLWALTVPDTAIGALNAVSALVSTRTHKKNENYRLINSPRVTGPDSESSPLHSRSQALHHLSPPLTCSRAGFLQSKTHLLVQTLHYQLGNCYLNQLLKSAMCPSWESRKIHEANFITQKSNDPPI